MFRMKEHKIYENYSSILENNQFKTIIKRAFLEIFVKTKLQKINYYFLNLNNHSSSTHKILNTKQNCIN